MLMLDGSEGEGGGQMLRTSLGLSLVTGQPLQMVNIRAGREKPGLMRQHLTAVQAAATVSGGTVDGAAIGSKQLTFRPGSARAGEYTFRVGTAGSATLVLQTVLPALMLASGKSSLLLEGGTHNPAAPPFDFLDRAFLPLLRRMGVTVSATLEKPGFYPAGGGRFRVDIQPSSKLEGIELIERGALRRYGAKAMLACLPGDIAQRELRAIGERMGWGREHLHSEVVENADGPGNVVSIELESENVTEIFTGFGERGVPAESVAEAVAADAEAYIAAGVPVGCHLADQLLLPLALAGSGVFRSLAPTSHAKTQAEVIRKFVGVETRMHAISDGAWQFEVGRGATRA
jgi:RNA 3'-terminal phosphate cyclase (ATP)